MNNHKTDDTIEDLPESCYCPITNELMSDPCIVDATCCHTLARESALQWFEISRECVCPVCGAKLRSLKLIPNTVARDLIAMYEYTSIVRQNSSTVENKGDSSTDDHIQAKKNKSLVNIFRRRSPFLNKPNVMKNSGKSKQECCQLVPVNGLTDKQVLDSLLTISSVNDIVNVMMDRPLNAAIQGRACHRLVDALRVMQGEDNDNDLEELLKLNSSGAIRLILAAMKNFTDSTYVQKCACWALYSITYRSDLYQREVQRNHGLPVLMSILRLHAQKDENIAVSAFGTLQSLAYRNTMVKKEMMSIGNGIIDLATKVITTHIQSEYVLESVCSFLCELFDSNIDLSDKKDDDIVHLLKDICVMFPLSRCSYLAQGSLLALGIQHTVTTVDTSDVTDFIHNEPERSSNEFSKHRDDSVNIIVDVVKDISDTFFSMKARNI